MRYNIFIGTHHKTGTHWMLGAFSELANILNVPFYNISKMVVDQADRLLKDADNNRKRYIVFHEHSRFPDQALRNNARGLHLIRDPLDVLISAVRYHETTDAKWVHKPQSRFDGRSVHQIINSLDSFQDKLLFEIEEVGERNIHALSEFERGATFRDVHYEDLISDDRLVYSAALFEYLGLDAYEVALACCIMWRNSLFGALREVKNDHVKDGSAKQFLKIYEANTRTRFDEKYAEIRSKLGYHDERIPGERASTPGKVTEPLDKVLYFYSLSERQTSTVNALKAIIETSPERPEARALIIREYLDSGNLQAALSCADDACRYDYSHTALSSQMANAYKKAGRNGDAITVLRRVVATKPKWVRGWVTLADLLRKQGDYKAACSALEDGQQKNPGNRRLKELLDELG